MKKKKRKNKITKEDTSDYYTEVFGKGEKLEEISDKEKSKLFEKFREKEYFSPLVFAIGLLIISFTIGVEYFFFLLMASLVVGAFMSLLYGIYTGLDLDVSGTKFISKTERRFITFCAILVFIIYFGLLFIASIPPF